jgi:hypothetical protein
MLSKNRDSNLGLVFIVIVIIFIIFVVIAFTIWLFSSTEEPYEHYKYEPVRDLKAESTDEITDCTSDIDVSWTYSPFLSDLGTEDHYSVIENSDNITFSFYVGVPGTSFIKSKTIYKPLKNEWYYKTYVPGKTKYNHTLIGINLEKGIDYKIVMYVTNTDVTKRPRAKDADPVYSDEFNTTNTNNCNIEEVTTCGQLLNRLKNSCSDYIPDSFPDGFPPDGVPSLKYNSIPYVDTDKSIYHLDNNGKTSITINWGYYDVTGIQFLYSVTYDDGNSLIYKSWMEASIDAGSNYSSTLLVEGLTIDTDYRIVMYVSSNTSSGKSINKHQDSDKTYSSIFKVKAYMAKEPKLTISDKTPTKTYTVDSSKPNATIVINWTVDCNSYDKNYCPSGFIFSVDIEGTDSAGGTLLFPFYYFSKTDDSYKVTLDYDSVKTEYTGTFIISNSNYTFTIDKLLPSGYTYDVVVTMYRWTGVDYNYKDEYDIYEDTVNGLFKVVPEVVPVGTVTVGNVSNELYAFGNTIECTWSDSDYANTKSYNIGIYAKSGSTYNLVDDSDHNITKLTFIYSKIYKFTCDITCKTNNGVQLSSDGTKYYIGVQACSTSDGTNCGGKLSFNTNSFTVIECNIVDGNDSCSTILSETTLLKDDSYARIAYETNCSYADNIELCMFDQGYEFDQREISTTCKSYVDGKTTKNVCARTECPPMSVPYSSDGENITVGCITPLNINSDITGNNNFDYSFNIQPVNKAASYEKDGSSYDNLDYGFPFIAIIEGGTSDTDGIEPVYDKTGSIDLTTQKIAVPGMTDGKNVYLMPVDLQNFHPFIAWRTFTGITSYNKPYTPYGMASYRTIKDGNNTPIRTYSLYHINSNMFLDTSINYCGKSSSKDKGLACKLHLTKLDNIDSTGPSIKGTSAISICEFAPSSTNYNNIYPCMTSNIWNDRIDAGFPTSKTVNINDTPEIFNTRDETTSNNWNFRIDSNQNMIFFGKDTDTQGSLYHRSGSNKNNQISHMRRWVIGNNKEGNSYFWKNGLGKGDASYQAVTKVLADQWPNGPPYSPPTDRGTKIINFSAPIQYGIVPSYQQTEFYLEAYTWDSTYKTFKGLGFISDKGTNKYLGTLSNVDGVNKFKIWTNPINANGVVTINDISPIGTKYFMYYSYTASNHKNPEYMQFLLSAASPSPATTTMLKNGYITMTSTDSTKFTSNVTYLLCVNNDKFKDLYWVLSGTALMTKTSQDFTLLNSKNFTPIMLAMSWPSSS